MEKTQYFENAKNNDILSYVYMENEKVLAKKIRELELIGCNIFSCSIINTELKSSNVDGTIINNCEFKEVDWSYTDFSSLNVSETVFYKVNFTMSTMNNCKFSHCSFIDCDFNHIAMNNNTYEKCDLEDIKLEHSSTYLNYYEKCNFKKCIFERNIYYNIYSRCNFYNTRFEAKLFAYNFFGGFDEFDTIGLDVEKDCLLKQFRDDKLLINYITFELNLNKDYDNSAFQYIVIIGKLLESDIFIRDEQIYFIYNLLTYLVDNKEISPVTCVQLFMVMQQMFNTLKDKETFDKSKGVLNLILNKLSLVYQKMGQEYGYSSQDTSENNQIIKIIYEKKPDIDICTLINEIKSSLKIESPDAIRIKAKKGSYIEWIHICERVIPCLQLFIDMLGIGITVWQIKKNKKEYITANNELETDSNDLLSLIQTTLEKQKFNPEVNITLQIIMKHDVVAQKDFKGYKKSNIRSIEIINQKN